MAYLRERSRTSPSEAICRSVAWPFSVRGVGSAQCSTPSRAGSRSTSAGPACIARSNAASLCAETARVGVHQQSMSSGNCRNGGENTR